MAGFDEDFDGVENAESSSNGLPFITPGTYKLQVEKLSYIQSKKSTDRFTVGEFSVLEASGESARPAGTRIKHMVKMGTLNSKGNVKSMFAAIIGEPKPTKDEIMQALAPDQPCRGQVVEAFASNVKTKKGTDFTVVEYTKPAPVEASA